MSTNKVDITCPSDSVIGYLDITNKNESSCPLTEIQKITSTCNGENKCSVDGELLKCENYDFEVKYNCKKGEDKLLEGSFNINNLVENKVVSSVSNTENVKTTAIESPTECVCPVAQPIEPSIGSILNDTKTITVKFINDYKYHIGGSMLGVMCLLFIILILLLRR